VNDDVAVPEHEGAVLEDRPAEEQPSPSPVRSPAEAFAELSTLIEATRRDTAQIAEYVRGSATRLQRTNDAVFLEGADAALRAIIRLDGLLFKAQRDASTAATSTPKRRRVTGIFGRLFFRSERKTSAAHDAERLGFVALLRDAVHGELRSLEITVLEPTVGEEPDLRTVVTIANRPTARLRPWREGSVAEVVTPGYVLRTDSTERVLAKAEVVIWRARKEPPAELLTNIEVPHESAEIDEAPHETEAEREHN
jgi:hypothetical protein